MVKEIDHIGFAVKDLKNQLHFYKDLLGLECSQMEEVEEQKVRIAILTVGNIRIELLEPTSEESPIAKFLNKRGEGIHHIAYKVDNIVEALNKAESQHIELIDVVPRVGAGGKKIAFLHPKSTGGVLTEFCQEL